MARASKKEIYNEKKITTFAKKEKNNIRTRDPPGTYSIKGEKTSRSEKQTLK